MFSLLRLPIETPFPLTGFAPDYAEYYNAAIDSRVVLDSKGKPRIYFIF